MDAAHPLFQPRRIPGDVVVHHQVAELEIDPLAGRVGGDQETDALLVAESRDLLLPLRPVHAAVDLGHPPGVAEPLQPPDQVVHGVPVLAEDEPLLPSVGRIVEDPPELGELGLLAGVMKPPGAVP